MSTTENARAFPTQTKNPWINLGKEIKCGKHRTPEELSALKRLIVKFEDLFGSPNMPMGQAKVKPVEFDTGTAKTVWQPVRRLTQKEREMVKAETDKLVKQGLWEPRISPWQSPNHIAPKPGNNPLIKIVGDYKSFNKVLVEPK